MLKITTTLLRLPRSYLRARSNTIRRRFRSSVVLFAAAASMSMASAQPPAGPGASFMNVSTGLCVNRANDLEALRSELKAKGFPTMQEPAAQAVLGGHPGDAWPVPEGGTMGNLILVLPSDHHECTLLARRGIPSDAERQFVAKVAAAPPPFVSEKRTDEQSSTTERGVLHTLGYVWASKNASKGFAFLLTTATEHSEASAQLKATVTRISTE